MTSAPIALVTGTSTGIGLWTAVGLARSGATVVATMRDLDRSGPLRIAAAAARVELDYRVLDVVDRDSARACLDGVTSELGPIEILVNNAGRGRVDTLEDLDDVALQEQLDVNYLAVAALTRHVLPGMRQLGRGRIVTVTSVGGAVGQPFADAYCGAKFAVEGLMQSLAPVAARFGIGISIVEPAAVSSEFAANTGADSEVIDPADPYGQLRAAYLRRTGAAYASAQTPQAAADVIVEAATTTTPKFRWQTSPSAAAFVGLALADPDGSRVLGVTSTWLDV